MSADDLASLVPPRRERRAVLDLSMFDDVGQASPRPSDLSQSPAPETAPAERSAEKASDRVGAFLSQEVKDNEVPLNLPTELQEYLPADLWRRVNVASPPRGILINALERLRSVQYLLSTFLPRNLVQEKNRQPFPGRVRGQSLSGTLLFADVSGFTALSEKLAGFGVQGAEQLTQHMNEYFAHMLDILAHAGGIVLKFAGDALLVFFPQDEDPDLARCALRAFKAGQAMLRAMDTIGMIDTPAGPVRLRMKLGIASGQFLAASVGTAQRMEYIVSGTAIQQVMAAEGMASSAGVMVLTADAYQVVQPLLPAPPPPAKRLKDGFHQLGLGLAPSDSDYDLHLGEKRQRGGIPLDSSLQMIVAEMTLVGSRIQALKPYLAPELAAVVLAQAGKRGVGSQFRPTAVMFCNFKGPDALLDLWGEAGVQRVVSLLNAYFTAMNSVIARYGGIVSRIDPYSSGSKLLALFGAPTAHEDDPQRAASAALAMQQELDLLNEAWLRKFARHLPADWSQPLIQQRIGVTYGEAFAGQVGSAIRREYTVMGDEVNLSARLMSAAEMGRILISPSMVEKVQDDFELSPRPAIKVKGKSKPIAIMQVDGPQEDALLRRVRSRPPIMGREMELALGSRLLSDCVNGRGAVLVVQGGPGVGKSHLCDALLQRAAERGLRIFTALCHSYQAESSLAAWGGLLLQMAGITSLDYSEERRQLKFAHFIQTLQLDPPSASALAASAGLDRRAFEAPAPSASPEASADVDLATLARTSRRRGSRLEMLDALEQSGAVPASTFSGRQRHAASEAMWQALHALAGQTPLVIFFEDAHFLDPDSLALLSFINERLARTPLLILLARRSEGLSGAGKVGRVLELQPLSPEATYDLVARLLVTDLAQVIHEQTGGNPLQVGEITRWFMHSRRINPDELKSILQASDFMQKMVLSRLEELPEQQRQAARAASVIGASFRVSELQALLTDVDAVTLHGMVDGLRDARLVRLTNPGADPAYIFSQAVVRDILYSSLPFEERRLLHARLALFLSTPRSARRRAQARLASFYDEAPAENEAALERQVIAYHYEQAGQFLPAAQQRLLAAHEARANRLLDTAEHNYQQALADLDQPPDATAGDVPVAEVALARLQSLLGAGDMRLLAADFVNAASLYESVFARLDASDPAQAALAPGLRLRLALVWPTQNRPADALALLQSHASESDPPGLAALAWLHWRMGKRDAKRYVRQARQSLPLSAAAWAERVAIMLDEWEGRVEDAILDYNQVQSFAAAGLALIALGRKQRQKQRREDALHSFTSAARVCPAIAALAFFNQAELRWLSGELQTAEQLLAQAQAALPTAPARLQANGSSALRKAFKLLEKPSGKRWPTWDIQPYDDEIRISILFPTE